MNDNKRKELIELSGQVINGILSSDSSIFSKILDRTLHKNVAETAVEIAIKMLNKINTHLEQNE
jgi:hypothetical protein